MAKTLKIVQNNTAPAFTLDLDRDGEPINLTGCAVDLIISNGASIINAGHQACVVTDAAAGKVSYVPQVTDFPTAGKYICDIRITYGDLSKEILYSQLKLKVRAKLA